MDIQFIGAAQTVTGSSHLISVNGIKFLLDCGMYQGKRKVAFEMNRNFDVYNPEDIDFVILSHAHIDHSGNLPTLVKKGFIGKIYTTFATRDLATVMLRDSAHIQVKDVEFVNRRRKKKGQNLFEPLYTDIDVQQTLKQLVGLNYHHEFEPAPGIKFTFFDAGHILGSAMILMELMEDGKIIKLAFTGDLGRKNLPILRDPETLPNVDYLICESTYGARLHDSPTDMDANLAKIINRAIERKSKIIVPAFSVGRTQELVYSLHNIVKNNLAKNIPVFIDSPLSSNATDVFRMHPECFDNETAMFLLDHEDPFGFNKLHYIKDVEDSKRLNEVPGPCMIISSSGMCEAGRILHHLRNNIEDPNNIILMVGYSAENTLGRKLIDQEKVVRIFGDEHPVKAEVIVMNSFSAHADSNELLSFLDTFDRSRMQKIFLVHGELNQQLEFRIKINALGFKKVELPKRGDIFTL
ncbi:MAG: MBL fold metallo-hydrolase [Bacteroidetes bacterium]|nr:MBL fold metallo-hydrolase [Bacteroidota bacterium]